MVKTLNIMEVEESNQALTNGVFQLTMETFSEELSANTRTIDGLARAVKELTERTDQMIEQMAMPESLGDEIRDDIAAIKKAVIGRPQSITRKFQLLLFPEQDRKLFYRIVFGRWLVWLTVMLLLNNLYHFAIIWNNKRAEVELIQLKNDRTRKAWEILYRDGDEKLKASMEKAYRKGIIEQKRL